MFLGKRALFRAMVKNSQHNLIHQLSETMDSIWRMKLYQEDAQKDNRPEEVEFWKKFKETLEKQVAMLKEQLEKVISKEGLDISL